MDQALLEEYLRKYPSGHFAELAQLQLDRLLAQQGEKKVAIAPQEGNPFTKGSATANTAYRIGDSYQFQVMDPYSKAVQGTVSTEITQITETEVIFSDGRVFDLLGNLLRHRDGRRISASQLQPLEYAIGKRWSSRFTVTFPNGLTSTNDVDGHIATREKITVPAGTFDAFRIEVRGVIVAPKGVLRSELNAWRAPDLVRVPLVREEIRKAGGRTVYAERTELVSFKQA